MLIANRTQWPVTLGHEFVGDVVELGAGVTKWQIGDRVGGAWHSGHDSQCQQCMQGFFQGCVSQSITGLSRPGGCKLTLPTALGNQIYNETNK